MNAEYDLFLKYMVVGKDLVGKTSLLFRYCENAFSDIGLPVGPPIDFFVSSAYSEDKTVKLQIYDTNGLEHYAEIQHSYYRGVHAFILVYDITDRGTFDHIRIKKDQIDRYGSENAKLILVGNKCDMESKRRVTPQEGQDLANLYGMKFLECSAKDNKNVEKVFQSLTDAIVLGYNAKLTENSKVVPKKAPTSSIFGWLWKETDKGSTVSSVKANKIDTHSKSEGASSKPTVKSSSRPTVKLVDGGPTTKEIVVNDADTDRQEWRTHTSEVLAQTPLYCQGTGSCNIESLQSLDTASPKTLEYLRNLGDSGVVAEQQYLHIKRSPDLFVFYVTVCKGMYGTVTACLSISSGLVANQSKSKAEKAVSMLDSLVGSVGVAGVTLATGLIKYLVTMKSDADRVACVKRITTSFPSSASMKFIEILSRELTLLLEETIVKCHETPSGGWWKSVKRTVEWLNTHDNATPVEKFALGHTARLLSKLMWAKPADVVDSLQSLNRLIKWSIDSDLINGVSVDQRLKELRSGSEQAIISAPAVTVESSGKSSITISSINSDDAAVSMGSLKADVDSMKEEQSRKDEEIARMRSLLAKQEAEMAAQKREMETMKKQMSTLNTVFGGGEQLTAMNTKSIHQKLDEHLKVTTSNEAIVHELVKEVRMLREMVNNTEK